MRLHASEWTLLKQQAFADYIGVYAPIAAAIQRKHAWVHRWFYFELTAGSGAIQNGSGVIEGSPLLALQAFRQQPGFRVDCLFLEHIHGYADELARAVAALRDEWTEDDRARIRCEIHPYDHRDVLTQTERVQRGCGQMGLLYWDGLGRDLYPSHELRDWLNRNTRHDLLVMASGTAPKRMGRTRLDHMLLTAPRATWVSEPHGDWQWVFALATNWKPLAARFSAAGLPLWSVASPRGLANLDKLGLTRGERSRRDWLQLVEGEPPYRSYEEYLRHPRYRAVRVEALARANQRCECCGATATQVHHMPYPPWGEFDEPENLLAVCYRCHCRIEGKPE